MTNIVKLSSYLNIALACNREAVTEELLKALLTNYYHKGELQEFSLKEPLTVWTVQDMEELHTLAGITWDPELAATQEGIEEVVQVLSQTSLPPAIKLLSHWDLPLECAQDYRYFARLHWPERFTQQNLPTDLIHT